MAVGYESFGTSGFEEYTGVAWTSPDGTTWERSAAGETAFAGAELLTVAAGGPGLAAAGVVHELEDGLVSKNLGAAAAWTSADGLSWNRVMLPASGDEAESNTSVECIASWPGGLVVVGYVTARDPE